MAEWTNNWQRNHHQKLIDFSPMRQSFLYLPFIIYLLLTACVKDKPSTPDEELPSTVHRSMYISNEGSMGNGNASLSVYDLEKDSIYNNVFFQKNNQSVGDVLQSTIVVGEDLFLAVNNSDKVKVVDKNTFELKAEIPVSKPRYFLKVNDEKLYVSSIYYPKVFIINPKTYQLIGSISLDYPNSEGMLLRDEKVYIANWDTACNYLYEIDVHTDAVLQKINIGQKAPSQVLMDKNKDLWVLTGNIYKDVLHHWVHLDGDSKAILKTFEFSTHSDIVKPTWNATKDTLYFLAANYEGTTEYNGLYRISIGATSTPTAAFIPAQAYQYFWALGIDSVTNQIFLGNSKGFIQSSEVNIYSAQGQLLRSFSTGVGVGHFYFE